MSTNDRGGAPGAPPPSASDAGVTTGSYELLTGRLREAGTKLADAANRLNNARTEIFATATLTLAETDRLRTPTTAAARDVVALGPIALFGYHVTTMSTERRAVQDVFALYRPRRVSESNWDFVALDPEDPDWFLSDPGFVKDFDELFTYYAQTRLISLTVAEDRLFMVFGIGDAVSDVRVLRWQLGPDQPPRYVDAYGEGELGRPAQFDFNWTEVGREQITDGREQRVDVAGELHLTINSRAADEAHIEFRIDDVVEGGKVILTEPLLDATQAVTEIKLAYAPIGDLVLVRMLPYREATERFYVYNRLTRSLVRDDPLGENARVLPGDQGVIFPGGYHLGNGEARTFNTATGNWAFCARHVAPNGEDVLYTYHDAAAGRYLLCGYNVVTKTMATPITAAGYALFDDGTVVCLRDAEDPTRVHTVSVYTSPFCAPDVYSPPVPSDSFFGRIGNPELVAVLGECFALSRDVSKVDFNPALFEAFVARTRNLLDAYAWLDEPEAVGIGALLLSIRRSAGDVLDELAAVNDARRAAHDRLGEARLRAGDFVTDATAPIADADAFIELLTRGRAEQGALASLAEMRFVDGPAVAELVTTVADAYRSLSDRALAFLAAPDAFASIIAAIADGQRAADAAASAVEARGALETINAAGERIVALTEVISGLDAEDVPTKTAVLQALADVLARRNSAAALASSRVESLTSTENRSEFTAAVGVLGQRAATAVMTATDAADLDDAFASISAEIASLESRFGDVDEFATTLADERDRIFEQLTTRRDALASAHHARIDRLVTSVRRTLDTIGARARTIADRDEFEGFFATDALVARVRATIADLRAAGESGRADEIAVDLETTRSTARRAAVDRAELYDSEGTVRIGRHRFGVNATPFDLHLTTNADGNLELRLSGTELVEPVDESLFGGLADAVTQTYPSETATMARALYLAFDCCTAGITDAAGIRVHAQAQLGDGYEIGVHDTDAAAIVDAVAPLLADPRGRFAGTDRAVAGVWLTGLADSRRTEILARLQALRALRAVSPATGAETRLRAEIGGELTIVAERGGVPVDVASTVSYLIEAHDTLHVTAPAVELADGFATWAGGVGIELGALDFGELVACVADWAAGEPAGRANPARCAEAAFALIAGPDTVAEGSFDPAVTVTGLLGSHPTISNGTMVVDVDVAHGSWQAYRRDTLPRFVAAAERRRAFIADRRTTYDIDKLAPKPLPTFVRNQLISDVYLPLLGDNFAKQLGMTGAAQGLLMLISPPGYGKTTLVEYVANLLGFALVEVNGPALGSKVTSLDPAAAPDAASAAELVKLNRAFAMASNVMLYIDDIQHTSAELLSRFIPLCDATRRVDGVVDGQAATFDLSGKRFVIAMAGNPYTGNGQTFVLPDMLTNRADVYNLGDVIAGHRDAFASSYVEVGAGANAALAPVVAAAGDLAVFLEGVDAGVVDEAQLSRAYPPAELSAIRSTLGHLIRVRDELLTVNAAYISSASVDDALRGEPPFLLQGSYRNMAKIAARIVAQMTDAEVDAVVADHYRAEAQTLAGQATWNLTRLGALLEPTETNLLEAQRLRARWAEERDAQNPVTSVRAGLTGIEDALRER